MNEFMIFLLILGAEEHGPYVMLKEDHHFIVSANSFSDRIYLYRRLEKLIQA